MLSNDAVSICKSDGSRPSEILGLGRGMRVARSDIGAKLRPILAPAGTQTTSPLTVIGFSRSCPQSSPSSWAGKGWDWAWGGSNAGRGGNVSSANGHIACGVSDACQFQIGSLRQGSQTCDVVGPSLPLRRDTVVRADAAGVQAMACEERADLGGSPRFGRLRR